MSASRPVDTLIERVVRRGLCARCGSCVAACPAGVISMRDPLGDCLPVAGDGCTACGMCLAACPGDQMLFEPFERELFGSPAADARLGSFRTIRLAHAADHAVRRAGASGGVVTALLLDLLARGETRGAVVFGPHESEPWHGTGRIARTRGETLAAAQSRYHLSPLNETLAGRGAGGEPLAYVGLPCQVHGLRRLARAGWTGAAGLDPVIGIYCGNNLRYAATRAILRKLGVRRPEDAVYLAWREGKWPGSFLVRTGDGRERSIPKPHFNQAIPFYVNRRCLFCVDLANELADVSVGDGWAREGEGGEGWSIVIARSERGERLVARAITEGTIVAEGVDPAAAALMHAHAFDLKKRGGFLRIGLWARFGCAVPRCDRRPPRVGAGRRIAEALVSAQFAFCSSAAGRALFAVLPLGAAGRLFALARDVWRGPAARAGRP